MNSSNFQVIREELAVIIFNLEFDIKQIKKREAHWWKYAEQGNDLGTMSFNNLNNTRIELRKAKSRLKKLQSAMKELKNECNPFPKTKSTKRT